jgi:purine-binding chemotaxis protein CheW
LIAASNSCAASFRNCFSASSEIEPPPAFGARIRTDFIQGMGKVNGRFVILLDVNHVLAVDEMHLLTEVKDTAATELA